MSNKIESYPNKYVTDFLVNNGFKESVNNKSCFENDLCKIIIEKDHYEVLNNLGESSFSFNLNLYWLIGFLTWNNYIVSLNR